MPYEHPELEALWKAVGEMPECGLRRGVLADWLEERDGEVECEKCAHLLPHMAYSIFDDDCPHCDGTGRVSNGYAATAAGLRETEDQTPGHGHYGAVEFNMWSWCVGDKTYRAMELEHELFDALTGDKKGWLWWRWYPTAEAAIRDIVRAWCIVHGEGAK
jgi:hypothetical protein